MERKAFLLLKKWPFPSHITHDISTNVVVPSKEVNVWYLPTEVKLRRERKIGREDYRIRPDQTKRVRNQVIIVFHLGFFIVYSFFCTFDGRLFCLVGCNRRFDTVAHLQ